MENTPGGELARRLRELLNKNESILGFRIKVVERAGTPLARQFPLTNLFGGIPCGRTDCTTCAQGGENLPPCTRRSVVYENVCTTCHPEAVEGKEVKNENLRLPAIYVGETCRSLAERAKEHWADYKAGLDGSHTKKHHISHHGGIGQPQFHLRPVKFYRTALGRQVGEAVRIRRRGEENLLNSKAEFNRCKITRLSLPKKEELPTNHTIPALNNCQTEEESEKEANTGDDTRGLEVLLEERDYKDVTTRTATDWQVDPTQQVKRKEGGPRQGRDKLARLDLPGEGCESNQEGSPAVTSVTTPAPSKLPGLHTTKLPTEGRQKWQLSIQECLKRSRDLAETTPNQEKLTFAKNTLLPKLPREGRDYSQGRLAVTIPSERASKTARERLESENIELSTTPSVANSRIYAENSTKLPEAQPLTCPDKLPEDHVTTKPLPCSPPPASNGLTELLRRIYKNQPALCYYPNLTEDCASASKRPTLVQEKGGTGGFKTQMWKGSKYKHEDKNCDFTEGRCTKHHLELILKTEKVRKWKLCKSGIYRNVYEFTKTWICPYKPEPVTKPLNQTAGGNQSAKLRNPA